MNQHQGGDQCSFAVLSGNGKNRFRGAAPVVVNGFDEPLLKRQQLHRSADLGTLGDSANCLDEPNDALSPVHLAFAIGSCK
ncbi:hypothetical protein SDC9_171807 [bioreactor metagenome]|uniref:Uncharacterized protein n=1 Tax=bioreactor metagenome TaxID=1076179 RepID=A0A645GF51_9ZZZZ